MEKTKVEIVSSSSFEIENRAVGSGWAFFIFRERERAPSLQISGQSDRRFSTEQEVKLLYAARATRGNRFGGVLTTPRGRDLFLLALFFG